MKRLFVVLAMVCFVFGCAQTRVWTKSDITRNDFLTDNKSCYFGKSKQQHEMYKKCMQDKGYYLVNANKCKVLYPDNTEE